jgi:hypothetical protein
VGPIPSSAIAVYAGAKGLPSSIMELFEAVIRAMDRVYLETIEEARKKASKKRTAPSHIGERTTETKT